MKYIAYKIPAKRGYMGTNISPKRENTDLKRERFIRIVEIRVNKLLDSFDSLGKCANTKNYKYNNDDVKKIFAEIDKKLKEVRLLFQTSDGKKIRFRIK